jgi:hypothetical protein
MSCYIFSVLLILAIAGLGWHATLDREVGRGGALGPGPCDHQNPPTANYCARCGARLDRGRHP